jgi:hypothetical protein
MTTRSAAALAAVGSTAVPCLRFPGFGAGEYEHPEGACACFRGGLPPRRGTPAGSEALIAWLTAEEAALIWGTVEAAVA